MQEGIQIFESSQLSEQQFEELANLVADKTFKCNETIFSNGRSTNAALYLLREGTVELTRGRSNLIKPGAFFGEELLLLDTKQDEDTVNGASTKAPARYTAVAKEDCMYGVLSLSDCRTTFETSKMINVKTGEGLEILSERCSTEEQEERGKGAETGGDLEVLLEEHSTEEQEKRVEQSSSRSSKFICRKTSRPSRQSSHQWLSKLSKKGLRRAVQDNLKLEDLKKHEMLGTG